ncbi:PH domain-containing protein [Cellulomonas gilvus]|uniref:Low molecular weight protein antigen 6 PH domain-containing protein n=1 Tax=Cellulomonas gilvus (strain ATCC 13127 / NRRL B-14078) TaxID=593907 RepID=F7ZYV9_CELGA|nr:PH domain-containing protein [Cellulomonas gilvus]AEI11227.1 hypothetical protein Celgi_0708 [Cellulomonas gilvus ATCC 13127]
MASDGTVYRPTSRFFTTGGTWLFAGGWCAAAWVDAGVAGAVSALPACAGLAFGGWLAFWYPRVEVDDEAVRLVNPLRTVSVPWAALAHVSTQYAMTLVTPHGQYRAWAAPGPGAGHVARVSVSDVRAVSAGSADARGAVPMGDLPTAPSGSAALLVRRRWQRLVEEGRVEAGVADRTPVTNRWNVPAIAVLAVAAITTLIVALVG